MTGSIPSEPLIGAEKDRPLGTMMAALFAIALVIRLACFTGLIASDDLGYAKYAQEIAQGSYRLEAHHYALRYGVIVPLAAVYRLFGVHEWTTVLLPVVSSSLGPALVGMLAAMLSGVRAGWIAGLGLATFPVAVRYGSVLVPEPSLETLLLAGVLLFLVAEARDSVVRGVTAGFVLGISYLTKEPGAFVAMAVLLYALLRRPWRLAFAVAVGAAFVVGAELAWYQSRTGDAFFRVHVMAVHNRSAIAVAVNENLPYRLWKLYPRMMLVPSVDSGLHSLMAIALSAMAWLWQRSAKTLFLSLWAALPWLYLNFGTSSFQFYWALPAAPRYIGLVYAPLLVLSATRHRPMGGNLEQKAGGRPWNHRSVRRQRCLRGPHAANRVSDRSGQAIAAARQGGSPG